MTCKKEIISQHSLPFGKKGLFVKHKCKRIRFRIFLYYLLHKSYEYLRKAGRQYFSKAMQ